MESHRTTGWRNFVLTTVLATTLAILTQARGLDLSLDKELQALSTLPERARAVQQADPLLDDLNRAHELVNEGDLPSAEAVFRSVQASPFPWHSWAATSGLLAAYRRNGLVAEAFDLTGNVAEGAPHLRDLMYLWDGDTAVLAGELIAAQTSYEQASKAPSPDIAALAWRQLARLALLENDPLGAALAQRQLMANQFGQSRPEWTLAAALAYEAMAAGQLRVASLSALLHDGSCNPAVPCRIRSQAIGAESRDEIVLAGLVGFSFALSAEDQAWLGLARESNAVKTYEARSYCVPSQAMDGFQHPITVGAISQGYLEPLETGYHPGIDIQDVRPGAFFVAVARGCVLDAFSGPGGAAAIEHYGVPDSLTSQYSNTDGIFYSAGAAVSQGAVLGRTAEEGLHHELREVDHPYSNVADRVVLESAQLVSEHYQDPLSFYRAHAGQSSLQWIDEGAFHRSGAWTYLRGIGSRNDLRWAWTASDGAEAPVAHLHLDAIEDGPHEVWVFMPDLPRRSTRAKYRMLNTNDESVLLSAELDLSRHRDAWARVGAYSLAKGERYTLELSADTGEDGRRVVLDEVLLVHR